MYQTLDDLEKATQVYQTEENKSRRWVKWTFIVLWLVVSFLIVLIVYNLKIKENPSLKWQPLGNKINLGEDSVYSRLFQLPTEESNDKDIQSKNAEILSQIKNPQFWSWVIEDEIKDSWEEWSHEYKKENTEVIWYGLYCKGYEKDLSKCNYLVSFIEKDENRSYYRNGGCGSPVKYHCIKKGIVMDDIWNWSVFYDIYDWSKDNEDEVIQKYLWKDFESTYEWDYREIDVFRLLTNNDDWTTNYHLYIVDGNTWEILYKNSEKIISIYDARKIIAENAWIDINNVKYLDLEKNNLIYEANFSYNWRTYDFKIDAKDGTIINDAEEKDIWGEKAMEIALKDSWLKATDLWKDISHWHWEEKMLLMPEINKEWTGENAIYDIEIETEDGMVYSYQIKATDGKILLKHLSEQFVIYDKEWAKKNMVYKIKSTHKKPRNIEIKLSDLGMDDVFKFKDQIYLWLTFDWDKIVDWSIIDRPYKHMWKMTNDELDEYYNFESHYPIKIVDEKIDWEKENVYEIYLSKIDENVIYKYTIMTWRNCSYEIINDTEKDVIVYEGTYWSEKYSATPYLKEWYDWRWWGGCTTLDWDVRFSIMYKEALSDDLFKVIDEKEITYLSKFKVWDELNLKQRYNENYLYNDTNNDLTISVTDYWIVNAPEDFQFTVKPWKFAHCYEYTDIVKIIK